MAYNFVAGSTQAFNDTSFVPPAQPFSYSIAGRPTNVGARKSILSYHNNAVPGPNNGQLELNGISFGSNKGYANNTTSGTGNSVVATNTFTLSAWTNFSVCIPTSGGAPLTIYSKATKSTGSGTSPGSPAGVDRLQIGRQTSGTANTYNQYYDGDAARVAFWSGVELTDRERASLDVDFSPRRIRPQSLSTYRPLINSTNDMRRAAALAFVNTPTLARHPRSYGM
jgi:hypothetical protein